MVPAQPRERARDRRRSKTAQTNAATPVAPGGLPGGQYRPLTAEQVARIQAAALVVLAETGVEVMPSPCRDVWQKAGARIDPERNRVFIPPALVAEALGRAARSVRLCGQTPEYDLDLSGSRVYLGTGGAAVKVLHLDGQVRPSRLRDIYDIGRLVDTLEHIHFYLRPVVARDLSNELLDVNTYYAALASTRKHVMGNSFTAQSVHDVLRLASLIAGGPSASPEQGLAALRERPFVSWTNCWIVSPLRFAPETVAVLDAIVASGMPVAISSAPQAGATAPVTLAGTLVQLTAEQLAGLTYINLLRPGHPVLLGYVPSVADLRTGSFTGGSAEFALMNAAAAQLAHAYGLPVYNSSALTDSKLPDVQAGYEKGLSTATAALAGANFIHHSAGFLESLLAVAYEQYVIDDDINGAVMRLVRGIEVTDETLAVGVIDEVCRGEGHFLGHPQTLANMNTEYYYPHTADRSSRDAWEAAGALDMRQRARQRASEVLGRYWPTHLPEAVDDAIRAEFDIRLPREQMRAPGNTAGVMA